MVSLFSTRSRVDRLKWCHLLDCWAARVQFCREVALEYNEVIGRLKKRALDFHRVLHAHGVSTRDLSETEFFQRTLDTTERIAKNIAEGIGDPGATILGFPEVLLFDLSDAVYTTTWDTEDGAEELFERLGELLEETPFRFAWRYDDRQQRLSFQIDSTGWSVACVHLDQDDLWINPLDFSQLEPRLNDYLESRGWTLYPATMGDQTLRFVLMPLKAVYAVKDYLLAAYPEIHPSYDPRSEWLHTGVSVSELPSSIWGP